MKKFLFTFLFCALPLVVSAQMGGAFGTGGTGSLDLSTLLPIIADSSMWTAGSHIHAIKPRDGKTVEADSGKFGALHVTGNTTLDGNLTMVTTATEQVKLGTGSNAAPELSSVGDTNTGIRFPGGDKMQLVQGGLNSHTFRPYQYTQTASDGDTLSINADPSFTYFRSTNTFYFYKGSVYFGWDGNGLYAVSDTKSIGLASAKWQNYWGSDYINLGGKSQTARLLISGESTIAGTDSSWDINATGGVPTATAYHTGTFSNGGRRHYFGPDTTLINYAKTGRDSTVTVNSKGYIGLNIAPNYNLDIYQASPSANQVLFNVGTSDDANRADIDEDGDLRIDGSITLSGSTQGIMGNVADIFLSAEDNLFISMDNNNNDADTRYIDFSKNGQVGTGVSLVRLLETGNLGLGTIVPQAKLSVVGADGTGTGIHVVSSDLNINRTTWAQATDTSSVEHRLDSAGNALTKWVAADGDSARIHVRTDSTELYSKNALVFDAPAVLIGASNVGVSKIDTVFTAGFVPRWVKFTSGAKSWYSPVYADTTGKW